MNIKLSKDSTLPGVFRATFGKRKVLISLSKLDTALGIVPSDDAVRQAFNDNSKPGDQVAGPLIAVCRMDTGSLDTGPTPAFSSAGSE